MLTDKVLTQEAEEIARRHTRAELYTLRRALTEIIARRERKQKPRPYKMHGVKLGPVSIDE